MNWRRSMVVWIAVVAMLAAAVPLLAGSSPAAKRPDVRYPIKSDVLPSLRGVPAPPSLRLEPREVPNRPTVRSAVPGESANVQTVPGAPNTPDPSAGWPGLVNNDNAAPQGDGLVEPPDTQGDVGTDYYIQWVNSMFAVYDKTGTKVYPTAPATAAKGSILWSGFGGACQNDNDGDPITLWDPLAQRWVMSQFAVSTNYGSGPYYQCVAVSQTSDPMGAWNRYAFTWPLSHFPDYPKLGVWNDAYYITTNDFNAGLTSFVGVTVGAFDRAKMLTGDASAGFVNFQLDPNVDYSMLPADFDGINPPPAGAPGLFGEFQDSTWTGLSNDQIWLYEFHVDWTNPANSTFGVGATHTPNHQMNITNVSANCSGRVCVPMPAGGESVDDIDFRTMYRLAYRNNTVGGEMMVTSMTVAGGGKAGVWWGEFHKTGTVWDTYQDGVYSPSDTTHRWMPSIAQDTNGNIMLGYSASSSTVYPSVWYVGRLATDTLGTMGDEKILAVGSATKTSGYNRWGDYSMMSIDPVDDCTFWYTQEYLTSGGNFQWQTFIGSMKFPSCSSGPTGTVQGTVTNAGTGNPIAGALVQVGAYSTSTNPSGFYTMTVPVGTYDVTASKFGFGPVTATGIVVDEGTTVTQDFALSAVGSYTVDGFVTSADHQWPLWAKIDVKSGATVVATLYTSPWNGYYEVVLPNGLSYDFTVHSMYVGYVDEVRPVTLASADQTQNFTLVAASGNPAYACMLDGGINEHFEGDFPPPGWTVKNNGTITNNIWKRNDVWGRANMTGGTGFAAAADSDKAGNGSGPFDTELWSPAIKMPATPRNLVFKSAFTSYSGQTGTFAVSTNGGATWTTLLTVTATTVNEPTFDMTAYANQTIILRWTFVSPSWAYWWQIDDVRTQTIPPPPPPPVSQWVQAFDGVTAPALPSGWAMVRTAGTNTATAWKTNAGTVHPTGGGTHSGTNLAYFNSFSVNSPNAARLYKTTGENISSGTGYLRLWMYHDTGYTSADNVQVQYSTDGGTTWNNTGSPIARYTGSVGWAQHEVMMLGVSGASVLIGLNATSAYGNDIHIDDVEFLLGAAATPPVADTPTLTCSAVAGSMVAGFVTDENSTNGLVDARVNRDLGGSAMTMAATGNLPAGFYYMFSPKPVVTAPEGPSTRTFTASKTGYGSVSHQVLLVPDTINRLDFVLPSGWLEVTPTLLKSWVHPTETEDFTLNLINHGGLPVNYKLLTMPVTATWPHSARVAPPNGNQRPASIGRAMHAPDHLRPAPHVDRLLAAVGAYAVDLSGSSLVKFADVNVPGTWTSIGPAASYFGGDFLNGDFSKLYVLDYDTNQLASLDTATAAATIIGSAPPNAGQSWTGLAGAADGTLYASSTDLTTSVLYRINPATAAVSAIGTITNGAGIIAIAINPAGAMFGVDIVSDSLIQINPATGAGTVVGPLGIDANYAQGMDFDDLTGVLYWAAYSDQGELRIIDTTTGGSSLVGAFPGGAEVDAIAITSFAGAGLPWLELTPTEGIVPSYLQQDVNAHFISDGATYFGLHRATVKVTHDTAYAVPDVNACMTRAFLDVPKGTWQDTHIHALAGTRVVGSYDEFGYFRPDISMTRGSMARWLLRAKYGPDYTPTPCTGIFADVSCELTPNADYIEALYNEGITGGCATSPLRYCPADPVQRQHMAVFMLRSKLGSTYHPPACTGIFADVACPSTYAGWVEDLYNRTITGGCTTSPLNYCPSRVSTRAEMSVFVNKTFQIPTTCVLP